MGKNRQVGLQMIMRNIENLKLGIKFSSYKTKLKGKKARFVASRVGPRTDVTQIQGTAIIFMP